MSPVAHYCTQITEMKGLGMRLSKYPNATGHILCSCKRQMKQLKIQYSSTSSLQCIFIFVCKMSIFRYLHKDSFVFVLVFCQELSETYICFSNTVLPDLTILCFSLIFQNISYREKKSYDKVKWGLQIILVSVDAFFCSNFMLEHFFMSLNIKKGSHFIFLNNSIRRA